MTSRGDSCRLACVATGGGGSCAYRYHQQPLIDQNFKLRRDSQAIRLPATPSPTIHPYHLSTGVEPLASTRSQSSAARFIRTASSAERTPDSDRKRSVPFGVSGSSRSTSASTRASPSGDRRRSLSRSLSKSAAVTTEGYATEGIQATGWEDAEDDQWLKPERRSAGRWAYFC